MDDLQSECGHKARSTVALLPPPRLVGDRLQGRDDDGRVGEEVVIGARDDVEASPTHERMFERARALQRNALVAVAVCARQSAPQHR